MKTFAVESETVQSGRAALMLQQDLLSELSEQVTIINKESRIIHLPYRELDPRIMSTFEQDRCYHISKKHLFFRVLRGYRFWLMTSLVYEREA